MPALTGFRNNDSASCGGGAVWALEQPLRAGGPGTPQAAVSVSKRRAAAPALPSVACWPRTAIIVCLKFYCLIILHGTDRRL